MNEIRNSTLFDTFCHTQNLRGMVDWNTCPTTTTTPKLVNIFHIEFWSLLDMVSDIYVCMVFSTLTAWRSFPSVRTTWSAFRPASLTVSVASGRSASSTRWPVSSTSSIPTPVKVTTFFDLLNATGVETRLWRILNHISSFLYAVFFCILTLDMRRSFEVDPLHSILWLASFYWVKYNTSRSKSDTKIYFRHS